jgi:hypothetical protein
VGFVAERRQLDEPHAVRVAAELLARSVECKPRLADAARAEQRDDAVPAEQIADTAEVVVATDQGGRRNRQVVGRRQLRPVPLAR